MLTIAETIEVGYMSVPLAINANARGNLFGPKLTAPTSPLTILMATQALEWGSDGGQDAEGLRNLANYTYWLCGKYGLQAQYIIGLNNGGGTVVPGGGFTRPTQIDFEVDSTSFIPEGTTTKQFPSSWIGFDILFNRNAIAQNTVVVTDNTYYSWDRTTAFLTLLGPAPANGAAQSTEIFQFSPV